MKSRILWQNNDCFYRADATKRGFSASKKKVIDTDFMRKLRNILLLALTCLPVLSCSVLGSDMLYDIAGITLRIYRSDADGNDSLNPDVNAEGFDTGKVTVVWEGKTYRVEESEDSGVSPMTYLPIFYGLRLSTDNFGKWYFWFGELSGEDDIDNKDLVIDWGDGTSDTVTVYNRLKWKVNGEPSITRRFYINGVKQNSDIPVFKFVK